MSMDMAAPQSRKSIVSHDNWHLSTWKHRAWLATACTLLFLALVKAVLLTAMAPFDSQSWLQLTSAALAAYVLVDLVSGIYHWALDNYGSAETPIVGLQIDSFQGHHKQPWAITKRQVANNLYVPAMVTTAVVLPVYIWCHGAALQVFVGVFMGLGMFCQQFHAWAHTCKERLPAVVVALQDAGIIVGREDHAAHHQPPFDRNYCIVSGIWNRLLDESKFFRKLEIGIFHMVGAGPLSWPSAVEKLRD